MPQRHTKVRNDVHLELALLFDVGIRSGNKWKWSFQRGRMLSKEHPYIHATKRPGRRSNPFN